MGKATYAVVGVFEDTAVAEDVARELSDSGISESNIQVTSAAEYASEVARGGTGLSGDRPRDTSAGGLRGFFERLFGSDEHTRDRDDYAEAARRGDTVVVVWAEETQQDRVAEIMNRYDPVDIDQRAASWRGTGSFSSTPGSVPLTSKELGREGTREGWAGEERRIPVVEEQVQVDKRPVLRGGVRVYRSVREQPVEQTINLREERVHVDRRPADRPATSADLRTSDEVLEFTESVEEPVVRKSTRVVEDVVVGKEAQDRTETVRDTVRRTDVHVEHLEGETASQSSVSGYGDVDYDTDFRRDFESRYGSARGASYDTYAPAYRYGYEMANDERYRGRDWDDVESTLKTDYLRRNPTSTWDRIRGAVRYGWEKVTRQRP
jgi:uncharacterized protein (TIGR02271 family)